jgi:hypothetical protein
LNYAADWHDIVQCNSNKNINLKKSLLAGLNQMINTKNTDNWLSDLDYLCSIGMAFIINNVELPLKNHRPTYSYGIDEYILSSLFTLDYFKNKSIYFNQLFHIFDLGDIYIIVILIILNYLINNNQITEKSTEKDFIQIIEKYRNITNFPNDEIKKCFRILLAILPTKYNMIHTLYSHTDSKKFLNLNIYELYFKKLNERSNEKQIIENEPLSLKKLEKLGISCNMTVLGTASEWCIQPYIYIKSNEINCPPENYISGFYYENPPSLDIGFIRQPSDLKYAIKALENNNLKIKLNRSDYKINVENENFKNDAEKNIDGVYGHIKAALQNIILLYGDIDPDFGITQGEIIADSVSKLNPDAPTQSKVWCPLIWKALNLANYDVPRYWYQVELKDADYATFNNKVIELAKLPGWAKYAVEVLTSDNYNYNENDNSFESQIVITKANNYKNSAKDKDFSKYMMSTY